MDVRRAGAVGAMALGLALGSAPAWAEEATPDTGCTSYPVEETEPGAGEGETSTEEPAPEETGEPAAEPTEEPPAEPTEEPPAEPTLDPSAGPGASEEPGPEPSEYTACLYSASGEAVQDTSASGAAEAAAGGTTAQLPRTGPASVDLLGLGAGLVVLGAAAVVVGRRRTA